MIWGANLTSHMIANRTESTTGTRFVFHTDCTFMGSMRRYVILENQKKVPEHLAEVDIFNKVQVDPYM